MGLQARCVGTAAALLALAALAAPVASEARVLKQQPVEPAVTTETNWYQGDQQLTLVPLGAYEEAVCNDGTPAAFYYSAGSAPNNWLLYLEGGFWCLGEESCWGRQVKEPAQVSSLGWSQATEAGGIFSRDATQNPVWATANMAYVRYCSSDAWMGNASAFSMHFRGQAIVQATLDELQASYGLTSGARLLFGGCSAGARGTMVLLDSVAAQMAGVGVEVRGMLDSSLWLDVQPTSSDALGGSLLEQAQDVYGFANVDAVIPPDCAAAYEEEPWKCIFGQYRMPFLKTPYFLSQSMFDDFQVDYNCGSTTQTDMQGKVNTVVTTDETACVDSFQDAMRATLAQLPAPSQTAAGIFSSTCSLHCTTNGPDWWTIQVGNQSLASLMTAWYFASDTPTVVSPCSGVECMQQCLAEEQKFPSGDFDATAQN